MMYLPNFFIVGAAKAGTTTLHYVLQQHPEIYLPWKQKETFYFSGIKKTDFSGPGSFYGNGIIEHWEEYVKLFEDAEEKKAVGEVCVAYLYFPGTAERIYEKISQAKIIIMLRNPVDRAFSNYMHHVRDGIEPLSFEEALEREEERKKLGYWWGFRYVEVGFYYQQVKKYIDVFGKEKVRVYIFEEFVKEPLTTIKDILEFLEVDSTFVPVIDHYNVSGRPRLKMLQKLINSSHPMKHAVATLIPKRHRHRVKNFVMRANLVKEEMLPSTRKMLQEIYREDVMRLESLLGWKLKLRRIWGYE